MEKVTVIKIGGDLLDDHSRLHAFLYAFSSVEGHRILVHGGGKAASRLMKKLNIPVKYHEGRRITDEDSLEVVTMVYAGMINKTLVAKLQSIGVNAIGMAGCDGDLVHAHMRKVKELDYGYAGDIDHINSLLITQLLKAGLVPTICPITHDGAGQILNTNADTIASAISSSLGSIYEVSLHYCFGIEGVMEDINNSGSLVEELDRETFTTLKSSGKIADGMIPKLANAFLASKNGVKDITVGNHIHFTQSSGFTRII
jgi:acetylglutamate kinase